MKDLVKPGLFIGNRRKESVSMYALLAISSILTLESLFHLVPLYSERQMLPFFIKYPNPVTMTDINYYSQLYDVAPSVQYISR